MLEQHQQVVDAARAPVVDERTLQRQRVAIRDKPEPAHIELSRRPRLVHVTNPPFLPDLPHTPYLPC